MPRAARSPEAVLRATKEPDFRQERSRRSYLALLEAATELFGRHGYDAVGTPEIAQRAGVSVGTFYRYFEDKHEVYLEIARRSMVQAYAETIEGLTPARFVGFARRDTIAGAISILFDNVLSRPHLSRSFSEMSLRDPEVADRLRRVDNQRMQLLRDAIGTVCSDPDEVEARSLLAFCAAIGNHFLAADHQGRTRPQVLARAGDLLLNPSSET